MNNQSNKVSFLDGALSVDRCSTKYTIQFDPDRAIEFVAEAAYYNNFTKQDLIDLIKKINEELPKKVFAESNPNNNSHHHFFMIGNEGSRVIYLVIHKFYLNCREREYGIKFDYAGFETKLKLWAREAKADEYQMTQDDENNLVFRFWWD